MNIIYGTFILSVISLFCRIIENYFHLFISSDILGIFSLLIYIVYKKNIPQSIENVSSNLLANLGLLFVPAGVGIISYLPFIKLNWKIIVFASVITTILGLIISALTFLLLRNNGKIKCNH